MQPTHCSKCNRKLSTNEYWLSCQQDDHVFLFNLSHDAWFLKVGDYYVNYSQKKYYLSTKTNIIMIPLEPFTFEQADIILNRCVKLISFL
jgi:hypothetical protein